MHFYSKEIDLVRLDQLEKLMKDFNHDSSRGKFYVGERLDIILEGIFLFGGVDSCTHKDRDGNIGTAHYFDPHNAGKLLNVGIQDVTKFSKDLMLVEKYFDKWKISQVNVVADISYELDAERHKLDFLEQNKIMSGKALELFRRHADKMEEEAQLVREVNYIAIYEDGFKITVPYENYHDMNVKINNHFSKLRLYFLMAIYEIQKKYNVK